MSLDNAARSSIVKHIGSQDIIFDHDGYIQNPFMWSEEVARFLANEVGLKTLSEAHWRVLRFVRDYYLEEGKEPMNHKIKLGTGMTIREIENLFPEGIARGVKRLAGLPKGKGCGAG